MRCPSCPSALEARGLVFDESFWTNAWFALLPFLVTALLVARFVRALDRRDPR